MKTLLAALLPAAMTLTGCLCGGWDGQDDQVLRTANGDAMQLCSNGGYSLMMANGTILEGYISHDGGLVAGSNGESGARAFTMTMEADGSQTSAELGGGWNTVVLDQVELDHAHVQCADLETRAWWPTSSTYLPNETAFTRTVGETTEEILFCADGTARIPTAGETAVYAETAYYTASAGKITITATKSFEAVFTTAGTLVPATVAGETTVAWTQVKPVVLTTGLRCSL
jgi:hypothetical protein